MDIYQHITDRIIAALETGKKTGEKLWNGAGEGAGLPINYSTQRAYTGINVLILWDAARRNGFSSNAWLTYKQAADLGGQVRQSEKAELAIFYKPLEKEAVNTDAGEVERDRIPMLKAFYLFNLDQIDGLDKPAMEAPTEFTAIEHAERVLQMSGARITIGGTRAFYQRAEDAIILPDKYRFAKAENFYAVALHELTHWVGHSSRLNREFGTRFGDEAYAFEELVAEIGSAFLNAELGFIDATLENHASYVDSWVTVLKRDKKAIVSAAALAAKAHQFIMGLVTPAPQEVAA